MTALFESRFDGQVNSNYEASAVELFEADGTWDGLPIGVVVATYGDDAVIPGADIPRLVAALNRYLAHNDRVLAQALADAVAARKKTSVNNPLNPHFDWLLNMLAGKDT